MYLVNQQDNNFIKIFNHSLFGNVRLIMLNNEPWFVGRDVADVLGYSNSNKAIQMHVDNEDKVLRSQLGHELGKLFSSVKDIQKAFGRQDNWFINESGLYSLIFSSNLPQAEYFREWVTSEVLPSIRKNGMFITEKNIEKLLEDPEEFLKTAVAAAQQILDKKK